MKILPKTREEAFNIIVEILNQGDIRYNAPEDEFILADFLMKDAISLEKREIPEIKEPKKEELFNLEPQAEAKYLAKTLLISEGFKENEIFYEIRFRGSQPDVLAESDKKENNKKIIVECFSCRIRKIIDYFKEADEVWIITRGLPPWEKIQYQKEKMQLFVFSKGKNWNLVENFKIQQQNQIKNIKNPLDIL